MHLKDLQATGVQNQAQSFIDKLRGPSGGLRGQRPVCNGKNPLMSKSWPLVASSQPRPIPSTRAAAAVASVEALQAPRKERIEETYSLGYSTNIEEKYEWGKELGKGGNGIVRVVVDRLTGEEYACKAIRKLPPEDCSDKKKAGHIDSIKREIEVLRRYGSSRVL